MPVKCGVILLNGNKYAMLVLHFKYVVNYKQYGNTDILGAID